MTIIAGVPEVAEHAQAARVDELGGAGRAAAAGCSCCSCCRCSWRRLCGRRRCSHPAADGESLFFLKRLYIKISD